MRKRQSVIGIATFFFIFFLSASVVLAVDIDSFNAEYVIDGKTTHTSYLIYPSASGPENFLIEVPNDAKIQLLSVDGIFTEYGEKSVDSKKSLMFMINSSSKKIKLDFSTQEYYDSGDRNYFIADIASRYPISSLTVRLTLPPDSFLAKGGKDGKAVFPQGRVETDGETLFVFWNKNDLLAEDSFAMFVSYRTMRSSTILYVLLTLAVLAAIYFAITYLIHRFDPRSFLNHVRSFGKVTEDKNPKKAELEPKKHHQKEALVEVAQPEPRREPKPSSILSHLKEEEQQIVNILQDREGHIEQGTLVIITGFSKAHLSRILAELEERKIIHKEKKGKKNVIWLKEGR